MSVWLALDTATDTASVALHDGAVVAESTWTSRRRHTVELAPRVERMLTGHGLAPKDLSGIAVAIGPGSYTGLRISLSLAKGIAVALGTSVVGVPTLDILATALVPTVAAAGGGELHAVLRAGRGRIVAARYAIEGATWPATEAAAQPARRPAHWPDPAELIVETVSEFAARVQGPSWVAGELDGPAREELTAAGLYVVPPESAVRRAGWLAAIGRDRAATSSTSVADLSPVYLGGDGT